MWYGFQNAGEKLSMNASENWVGVGPNAVNLREISVLSIPYEFRVGVAGMLLGTYACDLGEACPVLDSFCDIPAGPLKIGCLV
jgi:hypothetical protein